MVTRLFIILMVVFSCFNLYGIETLILNKNKDEYSLKQFLNLYIDSTNTNNIDDIINILEQGKFKPCKSDKPNYLFSNHTFWLYLSMYNNTLNHNWFINIDNSTLHNVQLYILDTNNNIIDTLFSGINYASDKLNFIYNNPAFYLHIKENIKINLLLKIRTHSAFLLPIKIYSLKSFYKNDRRDRTSVLLLFGMLISLLFVNLILYFILKERNYLFLILYLFFAIIHYTSLYGYINEILPDLHVKLKSVIWLLCYSISNVFITMFAFHYLDIQKYKYLKWIFQFTIIFHIIHLFLPLFNQIPMSYYINYVGISYLIGIVIFNYAGIYISVKRKKIAIYYITAFGSHLISAFLYNGMINDYFEYSLLFQYSGIIATTFFSVIISIGLSKQISFIRRERERTREYKMLSTKLKRDISEKNRLEEALKISLELNEMLINKTEEEIIEYGLEAGQRLTYSEIGYFHFVNEDQKTITLQKWSKNTLTMCTAAEKGEHYSIDQAGIWVECIYTKKPAIHNDYKNHPNRKGYPDGHFPVIRHMSVPIYEKNKILGVFGVGNKKTDYNNEDASQLLLLAENIWSVIKRKRAEEAVKNSEKELRKLNATKDKLFSIIAHDLKNPLGSMPGLTSMLMSDYNELSEVQKKEMIKLIHDTSIQSFKLLENLLIWSKSQRGKIAFKPKKINLYNLIEEIQVLVEPMLNEKTIIIKNFILKSETIKADYEMISAVMRNIITNAIKFTPNNGLIKITSERMNGEIDMEGIKISVSDTGVGMDAEKVKRLFTIDQNISTKGTNNETGTGLGLLLCKELINHHNGKIWAESEPGKGSRINIILPL